MCLPNNIAGGLPDTSPRRRWLAGVQRFGSLPGVVRRAARPDLGRWPRDVSEKAAHSRGSARSRTTLRRMVSSRWPRGAFRSPPPRTIQPARRGFVRRPATSGRQGRPSGYAPPGTMLTRSVRLARPTGSRTRRRQPTWASDFSRSSGAALGAAGVVPSAAALVIGGRATPRSRQAAQGAGPQSGALSHALVCVIGASPVPSTAIVYTSAWSSMPVMPSVMAVPSGENDAE
jgi:hypothetical protein